MIVDAWMQHLTPSVLRLPLFDSLRRWIGMAQIPEAIPHEQTIATMRAANIDRALACAWHGPMGALISNDEVAALVAAAPELFVGIASVELMRPMDGVRELRRAVKQLGMRGLRVLPWLWNLPPNDRRY